MDRFFIHGISPRNRAPTCSIGLAVKMPRPKNATALRSLFTTRGPCGRSEEAEETRRVRAGRQRALFVELLPLKTRRGQI